MTLKITFTYNNNTDETKIKIQDDDNVFSINKLDFLQDMRGLAENLYSKAVTQFLDKESFGKNLDLNAINKDINLSTKRNSLIINCLKSELENNLSQIEQCNLNINDEHSVTYLEKRKKELEERNEEIKIILDINDINE